MSLVNYSFGGKTFSSKRDGARLFSQLTTVFKIMKDGRWRTLRTLKRQVAARRVKSSEAAISARLRDLRKKQFGAHFVDRVYEGNGLWSYRLVVRK